MYASKAARPSSSSPSPLVSAQTTTAYRLRFAGVNSAGSSVGCTPKPAAVPSSWIALTAAGIESCRNPVVREETSTAGPGGSDRMNGVGGTERSAREGEGLVGAVALDAEERGVERRRQQEADLEGDVTERGVPAGHVADELLLVGEQQDRDRTRDEHGDP